MSDETKNITDATLNAGTVICVLRDILRRWLLILIVALIAVIGTFIYKDISYQPMYSTTTTFVATAAGTSSSTYQNLSAANTLATVFTEMLNSSLLRSEVIRQESTLSNFSGTISASVIPDTNLLTMTVTGTDPRMVFLMSKAVIEYHGVVTKHALGETVLEVLQDPSVPTYPINPLNAKRAALRVALLAAAAAAAVLGYLSYFSNRIRSKEEAKQKLSCNILGELQHERKPRTLRTFYRRSKAPLLVTNPTVSFHYTESVSKLCNRIEKRLKPGENILMVTSLLENEGKSTVAANIALAMTRKGKRVLLVDCDLRKPSCGLLLDLPKNSPGVLSVLQGKTSLEDAIQTTKRSDLHVLGGFRSLSNAADIAASKAMAALLRHTGELYDLVVVDTPPMSLTPDAESIAAFTHAALLVVRQNEADTETLNDAISVLEKSRTHLLGCVLNNVLGSGNFTPAYTKPYSHYGNYGKYGYYGYGASHKRTSHKKEAQDQS